MIVEFSALKWPSHSAEAGFLCLETFYMFLSKSRCLDQYMDLDELYTNAMSKFLHYLYMTIDV